MTNKPLWSIAFALLVAACGSDGALKHTMKLDSVVKAEPEQRTAVADAYERRDHAALELDHIRHQKQDNEHRLRIAEAEYDHAKEGHKIAELHAERGEMNFIKSIAESAAKRVAGHQTKQKQLKREIEWLEAREEYLEKREAFLEAEVAAAEAAFELSKAKLAVTLKTVPKGFRVEPFVGQAKAAEDVARGRKTAADSAASKEKALRPKG